MSIMNLAKFLVILPLSLFIAMQAVPVLAQGCTTPAECIEKGITQVDPDATQQKADDNIQKLINNIVDVFSLIVGVVSVIMIIFGGFKYITSGGDSGKIGSAKNTILYAVIGLIIVAFAQVLVNFVINKSTANNSSSNSNSSQKSSGSSTPCRELPNGSCAPGTGP